MREVGKEEVWVERQVGGRDFSLEGGRLGGKPRQEERGCVTMKGKCSDGRIKAVCCFHMVLCIYVYFLHVAVCRMFRNNCLLCVVGALSIICHCSKLQEEVLNFVHSPNKQITPSLISPLCHAGVVNNSSRQPISLEDLCEYSLHHQPLM